MGGQQLKDLYMQDAESSDMGQPTEPAVYTCSEEQLLSCKHNKISPCAQGPLKGSKQVAHCGHPVAWGRTRDIYSFLSSQGQEGVFLEGLGCKQAGNTMVEQKYGCQSTLRAMIK